MRLFRNEDISLLFMIELARSYGSGFISLTDIGNKHGISIFFLKKLVRTLKSHNLVQSKEGIGGGYKLVKSPQEVNLWQVINAFSQMEAKQNMLKVCPVHSNCLPQKIHTIIDNALEKSLSSITLKYLMYDNQ